MKVLGILNPNNFLPSPIITIAERKSNKGILNIVAIFPNGDIELVDRNSLKDTENDKPILKHLLQPQEIHNGQFGFQITDSELIFGDFDYICKYLLALLNENTDNNTILSDDHRDYVSDFLKSENINTSARYVTSKIAEGEIVVTPEKEKIVAKGNTAIIRKPNRHRGRGLGL